MTQAKKVYDLFLDDERYPSEISYLQLRWRICRTFKQAVLCVENYGLPRHINFDHDLGYEKERSNGQLVLCKTGMDFAKWLVEWCIDHDWPIFSFSVHSMNPVGAKNIEEYCAQYCRLAMQRKDGKSNEQTSASIS